MKEYTVTFSGEGVKQLTELRDFYDCEDYLEVIKLGISILQKNKENRQAKKQKEGKSYFDLSDEEKKEIIEKAARDSNEAQRELIKGLESATFKHDSEDTHYACEERIEIFGDSVECCACSGHDCRPEKEESA